MVGEGKERRKDLRVRGEGRQGEHQKVIRFKSPTSFSTVPGSAKQSSFSGSSSSKEEGARALGANQRNHPHQARHARLPSSPSHGPRQVPSDNGRHSFIGRYPNCRQLIASKVRIRSTQVGIMSAKASRRVSEAHQLSTL